MIDLSSDEVRYLEGLLSQARKDLLREIHHAATHDYKEWLKKELGVNERVTARLIAARGAPAGPPA